MQGDHGHLGIRYVRQRFDRQLLERHDAAGDEEEHAEHDEKRLPERKGNQAPDNAAALSFAHF